MDAAAVHAAVLHRLREHPTDAAHWLLNRPDRDVLSILFLNYRSRQGLRLTAFGLAQLRPWATHYEITLTSARPCDVAKLESRLALPYFVDARRIVLFEEESAVLLRLSNGDLTVFVQNT
jgi:hypothetical protein